MRKLAILTLFLATLWPSPAHAAIGRTGSGAGTTTLTFSATATNDLKVIFAFRSGNVTPPSLPAGWTSITTGATAAGGTVGSFRIGCNVSSSSGDTTSGTWTNATNVTGMSYSGTAANAIADCNTTGVGVNATSNAKTSTTASFPGITVSDGSNWVLGFLGDSVPSLCTPSGLTNVTSSGDASANDTNATVSTFTTTTCSVTSGTWMTEVVEILGLAAPAGTAPIRVQMVMGPTTTGLTNQIISTVDAYLNQGSLSGNIVLMAADFSDTEPVTIAASNDKGDTFTAVVTKLDATNLQKALLYCVPATAGSNKYTFTYTNSGQTRNARIGFLGEYANVTNCTADAVASANGSSTTMSAGSLGPLAHSNDLVVQYATADTGSTATSMAKAAATSSITWKLDAVDINVQPMAVQWGQYGTKNALTPVITQAPTHGWVTVAAAFPVSSTGTAGSGIRVVRRQNMNTQNETAGSVTLPFPIDAAGDLLVYGYSSVGTTTVSSYADSNSNTITSVGGNTNDSGSQLHYAKNVSTATLSDGNIVTATMAGTSGGNGRTFVFWDVAGADTSAPLNASFGTAGYLSCTGNLTSAGNATVCSGNLTPAQTGDLIFMAGGIAQNSITGVVTPSDAQYEACTFTPRVVPDFCDENNPFLSWKTPNTTTTSLVLSQDASNAANIGQYAISLAEFKPPAGGGPTFFPITKRAKLEKIDQ